jgi:hypothetical protein
MMPLETVFEQFFGANEAELRAAIAGAGDRPTKLVLTADVELMSNLVIPTGANIKLSGQNGQAFRLIAMRNVDAVEIQQNATLTLEHIEITRPVAATESSNSIHGVTIRPNATFIMNSGIISGHAGSGVSSNSANSVFIMHNGIIRDNLRSGVDGGPADALTFVMHGGTISNNKSTSLNHGGGVSGGDFTMYGGVIINNVSRYHGGGVYARQFVMNGGTITDNVAGGEIALGGIAGQGGGVYFSTVGSFTMNGGIISNNIASQGGGVAMSIAGGATGFTVNGGVIERNTARFVGGGVYVGGGVFTMKGGEIRENSALVNGGGVNITHLQSTFSFEGGWVHNNIAGTDNDLHIDTVAMFNNNLFTPSAENGGLGVEPINYSHTPPNLFSGSVALIIGNGNNNLTSDEFIRAIEMGFLSNVTHLRVERFNDVSAIAELTNLTSLALVNAQVVDITPIASLTNLTDLNLSSNRIADFAPLLSMTHLETLDLRNAGSSTINATIRAEIQAALPNTEITF